MRTKASRMKKDLFLLIFFSFGFYAILLDKKPGFTISNARLFESLSLISLTTIS
jgi:hypothetical protein